jgi:hypothetical protein
MNRVRIVAIAAAGIGVAVVAGSQFQSQDEPAAVATSDAGSVMQPVETALVPSPAPTQEAPQLAAAGVAPVTQTTPAADARGSVAANGSPAGRPRTADELFVALTGEQPPHVLNGDSIPGNDVPLVGIDNDAGAGQGAEMEIRRPDDLVVSNASVVPDLAVPAPSTAPEVVGPAQAQMLRDLTRDPTDPGPGFEPSRVDVATPVEVAPLDESLQAELDNCAVWVVATPAPGAMLDFSVYAPCDRGADVTVTHADLTIDTRIGADGQLMMMVPALAENAALTIGFADGRTQSDSTYVPDLAQHERVVLQWQGPAVMLLHAYEFGAEYGQAGHVHAGQPRAPGQDAGGFLTVLGDAQIEEGRRAQVYSYPRGETLRTGSVRLEIEAPVTDDSCGQPLSANAIEMLGGVTGESRRITVDMPGCDGEGGYVVLPGILPDLRIALN